MKKAGESLAAWIYSISNKQTSGSTGRSLSRRVKLDSSSITKESVLTQETDSENEKISINGATKKRRTVAKKNEVPLSHPVDEGADKPVVRNVKKKKILEISDNGGKF
jgi:hypothetical protein